MDLAAIRREYRTKGLDAAALGDDPIAAFGEWFADYATHDRADTNAVVLATADADTGRPSARTVLLKGVDDGRFVIYTNHHSRKGRELTANPQATLLFSWVALSRQIVVEGPMRPVPDEVSDDYFATRPRGSQIGAWASDQSAPLDDRATLEERAVSYEERFADCDVPRPPHWGGFALDPDRIEFWQGRENRLHDRLEFRRDAGRWVTQRLNP